MQQSPGDFETALHPPGKSFYRFSAPFPEFKRFQEMLRAFDSGPVRHVVQNSVKFHVFSRGEFGIQTRVLKDNAKALPYVVLPAARVKSVDFDFAARGFQQRSQHLDRGCLAGAIRAQKCEDLAPLDLQRDVVDGDDVTEFLD